MRYIIKIDVSGIQKFIFDIPSEGASKQLKARSFYVFAIPHIVLEMLRNRFGRENVEVIYNGGGNLFAFIIAKEDALRTFRTELENFEFEGNLFPFMSFVQEQSDFKTSMQTLNREVNKVKLQRQFKTAPYMAKQKEIDWKDFVKDFINAQSFKISTSTRGKNEISLGDFTLQFNRSGKDAFSLEGNILNKLPLQKDGGILEFAELAQKSKDEEADHKIAALKMDVDNLGMLFRDKDQKEYEELSQAMDNFFSKTIYSSVLKQKIDKGFIYPVFAGGDDLFFIGSWHIMPDVAKEIYHAFRNFAKNQLGRENLTLSAGIVLAHPSYPMIRLAEEAEHALELAKKNDENKDSITFLGEPMKWTEFDKCKNHAATFKDLIVNKGESKAVLHRIKQSDIGFLSQREKTLKNKKIKLPMVYRLKYYLRNIKEENRKVMESIFDEYSEALLDAFLKRKSENKPAIYAVAARWTELLIRNKEKNNKNEQL